MTGEAAQSDAIERLLAPSRRYRTLVAAGPDGQDALAGAGLEIEWLAEHVRSLALRFAEPLLARRRAAAGLAWPGIREAYRPDLLAEDLISAAAAVWDESWSTYERFAAERIRMRRLGLRGARVARLSRAEQRGHARRVGRPADVLPIAIHALARTPESEPWHAARLRLEREWAIAWEAMAGEVARIWKHEFAGRLAALEGLRRGLPGWMVGALSVLAAATAFFAASRLIP